MKIVQVCLYEIFPLWPRATAGATQPQTAARLTTDFIRIRKIFQNRIQIFHLTPLNILSALNEE